MRYRMFPLTIVGLAFATATCVGAETYCPGIGDSCSTESVCNPATNPNVVKCEDWEAGNHNGWDWDSVWGSDGDAPKQYKIINAGGYNSANALRMRIPERIDSTTGSDGTIYPGSDAGHISTLPHDTTIYVRWYAKWSPGYVYMPGYSDGQKHLYLMQYGTVNTNIRIMIQAPNSSDRSRAQILNSIDSHDNIFRYNGVAEQYVVPDRWYCIEVKAVPSTNATTPNGALTIWLNGALYMDHANIVTASCTGGACDWDQAPWLTSYYGGNPGPSHPEQYVWYDNFVTSKSRIGCADATANVPPAAVRNLARADAHAAP